MSVLDVEGDLEWNPEVSTISSSPLAIYDDGAIVYFKYVYVRYPGRWQATCVCNVSSLHAVLCTMYIIAIYVYHCCVSSLLCTIIAMCYSLLISSLLLIAVYQCRDSEEQLSDLGAEQKTELQKKENARWKSNV